MFTTPLPAHGKPYQGGVTPAEFKIARVINYRNSFLPMVIGRIRSEPVGSVVEVILRPHLFRLKMPPTLCLLRQRQFQ